MKKKYLVLKKWGGFKKGDEYVDDSGFTEEELDQFVEDKFLKPIEQETVAPTVTEVKQYHGQPIVSDGFREVNGITYRHIRLADGSEYDLTEEDYKLI